MIKSFFKRVFGDQNQRTITRLQKTVEHINSLEPQFQSLNDTELKAKTPAFKERLKNGETLDDILPEAFAAVREASRRTIGLRHYDVQLLGGMILHQSFVVEMRTGEGKTLVATLPLYLNALTGEGAHLITPNDYLAKYGVQWMGPIYEALGIHASVIQSGGGRPDEASFVYDPDYTNTDDRYQHLRPITRRAAYQADITYGTNNEFGFDYLRDNMIVDPTQSTQRELQYAIIDEVDSILIDEARTPLIISGPAEKPSELYSRFAQLVLNLQRDTDYEIDARSQIVILSDDGVAKVESMLNIEEEQSIYDSEHAHMLPHLDNALRAKEFFQLDKKYVVQDGEIVIVDEFTGRLMYGRRYSEGLHQAIEAKEGVEVRRESLTYATITFQNFFRMYNKLCGMTGTAETEKEELRKIYGLDVVVLTTNVEYRAQFGNLETKAVKPEESGATFGGALNEQMNYKVTIYDGPDNEHYYRRLDMPDQIYKTESAKFNAVITEIENVHKAKRPVLVGTTAIETSERLSKMLKARRIPHSILNAKYHEKEAVIIAQAGEPGTVTIATNMAGRGVDILLGGNPEGMARHKLRKEGLDLTEIHPADWENALKMTRQGIDPSAEKYPTRWAEVLQQMATQCAKNRELIYAQGGLHVIGTERHEARRIDNQLRGRAGRQGDPGSSRFYISLEDELMHRFGGERLQPWMDRAGLEDAPLEFKMIAKVIESIQERVEGYNFDIRKHVLEYDNVVNKQREVVYLERRKLLDRDDLSQDLLDMVNSKIEQVVSTKTGTDDEEADLSGLLAEIRRFVPVPKTYSVEDLEKLSPEAMIEQFSKWSERAYWNINKQLGEQTYRRLRQEELSIKTMAESKDPFYRLLVQKFNAELDAATLKEWQEQPFRRMPEHLENKAREIVTNAYRLYRDRRIMLRQLDNHWVRHLTSLDMLREGIGLRAVGQQNPLVAYQKEAFEMYGDMMASVQEQIVRSLFLVPQQATQPQQRRRPVFVAKHPPMRASGGSAQVEKTKQPYRGHKKLGRNDPCWCKSGKKYKDCHYRSDQKAASR